MAYKWGLLTTYKSWDDPPSSRVLGLRKEAIETLDPMFSRRGQMAVAPVKVVVLVPIVFLGSFKWDPFFSGDQTLGKCMVNISDCIVWVGNRIVYRIFICFRW